MIISPPFLFPGGDPHGDADADAAYVDRCMAGVTGITGLFSGQFPVSHQLCWHGGRHMSGRVDAHTVLPVRAIADGVLCYARKPTPTPTFPAGMTTRERDAALVDEPLGYVGWTHDGVVMLKHTTEIGEGVEVTYYSIYQHLKELSAGILALRPGEKVWRKDVLGKPGSIYGHHDRIHFEIVCDDENVKRLFARPTLSDDFDAAQADGRTDALWGDIHVAVPAGQPIYDQHPQLQPEQTYQLKIDDTLAGIARTFNTTLDGLKRLNGQHHASDADFATWFATKQAYLTTPRQPRPKRDDTTLKVPARYEPTPATPNPEAPDDRNPILRPIATTSSPRLVALRLYKSGKTTTYADGPVGESIESDTYDYDLFATAKKLFPNCGSAGYDLLRFGRVLGPDALHPDDADAAGHHAHFRKVRCTSTDGAGDIEEGWLDLNAPGVHVSSDADFAPYWGWRLINDDTNGDARCDSFNVFEAISGDHWRQVEQAISATGTAMARAVSDTITGFVLPTGRQFPIPPIEGTPTVEQTVEAVGDTLKAAEIMQLIQNEDTQRRLSRLICRFPTEWEKGTIDQRWRWLITERRHDLPARPTMERDTSMAPEDYPIFRRNVEALCFWEEAKAAGQLDELDGVHWHVDPREFIKVFRRCGWLSTFEILQLLPQKIVRGAGAGLRGPFYYERVQTLEEATDLINDNKNDLNKALRKYSVSTTTPRLAAFFGNALPETRWFATLEEGVKETGPLRAKYRPWSGRGFLQLTWPSNYFTYWDWRGAANILEPTMRKDLAKAQQEAHRNLDALANLEGCSGMETIRDWRGEIATTPFLATDSSGAYWAWTAAARYADQSAQNVAISITLASNSQLKAPDNSSIMTAYVNVPFRQVSCMINLPGAVNNAAPNLMGLVDRYSAYAHVQTVLIDTPFFSGTLDTPCGHERRIP